MLFINQYLITLIFIVISVWYIPAARANASDEDLLSKD